MTARHVAFSTVFVFCTFSFGIGPSFVAAQSRAIVGGSEQLQDLTVGFSRAPRLRRATSRSGIAWPDSVEMEVMVTNSASRLMPDIAVQFVSRPALGGGDVGQAVTNANGRATVRVPASFVPATPSGVGIIVVCLALADGVCSERRFLKFRKWADAQLSVEFFSSIAGPGGDGPSSETTTVAVALVPRVTFYPLQLRQVRLGVFATVPVTHQSSRLAFLSPPIGEDRGRSDLGATSESISGAGDALGGVIVNAADVLVFQASYNSRTGKLDALDPIIRSIALRPDPRFLSVADGFEAIDVSARLTLPANRRKQFLLQGFLSRYESRSLSATQEFVDPQRRFRIANRTFTAERQERWGTGLGMRFRSGSYEASVVGGFQREPTTRITEHPIVFANVGTVTASTFFLRQILGQITVSEPQPIQPFDLEGDDQWTGAVDVSTVGHVVDFGVNGVVGWGKAQGPAASISAHLDLNILR